MTAFGYDISTLSGTRCGHSRRQSTVAKACTLRGGWDLSRWEIVTPRRVPLRDVWPHEQRDFSRWVKDNIEFLNEHLGVTVDPESLEPEVATGPFAADLVGNGTDDETGDVVKVVIENQLERTDHDHLGKVVTYAANHDATHAVWIAAEARPEHVRAVQWLNTHPDLVVWLFVVEAVAVNDRQVAPSLRRIVGPSIVTRSVKAEKQADNLDALAQQSFWELVLQPARGQFADRRLFQRHQPRKGVHVWQTVPEIPTDMGWQFWVTSGGSWLCLRINATEEPLGDPDLWFQPLLDEREKIEASFGDTLQWVRKEGMAARLIRWDNPVPGGYRDDPETWPRAASSLVEAMDRLVTSVYPVLRTIRSNLEGLGNVDAGAGVAETPVPSQG